MLSRLTFISAVAAMALAVHAATPGSNPFIGKWVMDKSKTTATGGPADLQFEIKPDGDHGVVVKSRYQEPKSAVYPLLWVGIMTYELPLSIDGTEKTNQIGPFMHVSRTTIDGNTMTTDWRATIEKGDVEGKWIRTLSPDRKQMNLQVIAQASDGRKLDQTLVFKRK